MRCPGHRFIPYLLVLVALCCDAVRGAAARTVQLEQGGPKTLLQALEDSSVDHIVLGGSYSVASELPKTLPSPVGLNRNVTIEGPAAADPPVTLDLAFKRAVAMICKTCTVTLRHLVLKNARRGSGAAVDFFVGDDNGGTAELWLEDVWRMRLACPPGKDSADVIRNTQRSTVLPAPKGKQKLTVETVTFQGKSYPDSLRLQDVTQDFTLVHQEGAGHASASHSGGYALGSRNVVYLCENFVSEACMAEKAPDACVNELIDSLSQPQSRSAGVPLAAIVVPIVVVGALVAGLALWVLHRRRRRKQQQLYEADGVAKLGGPSSQGLSFNSGSGGAQPWAPGPHVEAAAADSVSDVHSAHTTHTTHKSRGGRRSLEVAMQPHGQQQGWQLVSTATAPNLEPVGTESGNDIVFGDFLGAGSYGRVYRAQWAGRDVACKVIQHDRSTLAAVAAEADLMLSMEHPNVVRAYHYCTFTYTEHSATSDKSRGSRHWSTGGGPLGNQRASTSDSHSSGGSRPRGDSAQGLSGPTGQPPQPSHSASNSGGSGSSARVLLLQRQQQEQAGALARQDSSDVLVTNLSFDAQGVQEATAIARSLLATSSITTKGSKGSGGKGNSRPSEDDGGMFGAGESAGLKHKAETWLVQEFCDMGTLTSIAASWATDDECDEQMLERLQLLQDAAQGLEALHGNHIVHGDINARNVLVSSSSSTSDVHMCAKVADLGLARCLAHHATHRTTNSCGTMSHMAPELLRYGRLSPAVDVYAFGVMMWELYSQGQPAFDKLHYGQFFETVVLRKVRPCVPAGMPPDYELLMRQCWAADPADRPSVSVLRQCLQLMVQDRQRRVRAAADVLGAAAAAGASDAGSRDGTAAGVQLSPPGVDTLPELHALLPGQQRALSIATGAGAAGTPTLSPGNSGTPLSNVSLSALFPDPGTPPEGDTVLFIGEDAAAAAGLGVAGAGSTAAAAPRPARRPPVVGARPLAAAGVATSPSTGDLESQLEKDPSVHGNRNWFV